MATKQDVQQAMWSVHFHRYFHPDARLGRSDSWNRLQPIRLKDAVDILWNDAEAKRGPKSAAELSPASLLAFTRLYTAFELRALYPQAFAQRPGDVADAFPVNLDKVRELYARTAPPVSSREGERRLTHALSARFTIPDYTDQGDVPRNPLDQLPCPEPAFRLDEEPSWGKVFPVKDYVLDVTYHSATGWLSVVWSIDIERPFSGMLKSLDPRNWDICSANVQIATVPNSPSDPCPMNDPGRPPNEGASWSNHFWEKLGVNGSQATELCNQLYFTFDVSNQRIITTFSDKDPTGITTQLDPQIEFDRGWAAYAPVQHGNNAWTRLRVVKYVKFTSAAVRDLAVLLLHNWAYDEVTSEVACIVI